MIKTKAGTELPLLNLRGKEYLEVKWRLVWFREEHSDWSIHTELLKFTDDYAVTCAKILNEKGVIMAMAHKREDVKHFPDNIEKSETGAIGRALALCGYGTQFAPEIEEGERIVDSPVVKQVKHKVITKPTSSMLLGLFGDLEKSGRSKQRMKDYMVNSLGVPSTDKLTMEQFNKLAEWIKGDELPDFEVPNK